MDEITAWNAYVQSSLPQIAADERELILTITVPLVANQDLFRVGWDIKRPGHGRFIAITSGRAVWDRLAPDPAAIHILTLIDECNRMLEPRDPREIR